MQSITLKQYPEVSAIDYLKAIMKSYQSRLETKMKKLFLQLIAFKTLQLISFRRGFGLEQVPAFDKAGCSHNVNKCSLARKKLCYSTSFYQQRAVHIETLTPPYIIGPKRGDQMLISSLPLCASTYFLILSKTVSHFVSF
jgi:hypothetical protein